MRDDRHDMHGHLVQVLAQVVDGGADALRGLGAVVDRVAVPQCSQMRSTSPSSRKWKRNP